MVTERSDQFTWFKKKHILHGYFLGGEETEKKPCVKHRTYLNCIKMLTTRNIKLIWHYHHFFKILNLTVHWYILLKKILATPFKSHGLFKNQFLKICDCILATFQKGKCLTYTLWGCRSPRCRPDSTALRPTEDRDSSSWNLRNTPSYKKGLGLAAPLQKHHVVSLWGFLRRFQLHLNSLKPIKVYRAGMTHLKTKKLKVKKVLT